MRPRPLSSAFSSSASASGLPRRRFYVPALDAPLPAPARRVAELAASRAIAGVVLGSFRVALAVTIASCVVAERHRRPVRVEREHGPAGAPLEWLLDLGRLSFGEALAICLARVDADLAEAWAHVVASSIDCRGCDPYMTRELIVAVLGESPSPIAEHFDAAAFFREGSRATALLAIREIVGEARERAAERLDDSALEEEASRLARRAGWIPEFLRAKRKPASLAAPAGSKVEEIDA